MLVECGPSVDTQYVAVTYDRVGHVGAHSAITDCVTELSGGAEGAFLMGWAHAVCMADF